ncbi:4Fe-4S binding protein [Chitinivorax sp. B]|uniref:4Fe-4S binding protein n=1 Tax=Chitinivorax sp. B TaxID=2502235 RepID=UPI0010F8A762|nr:4Fe-4S binding protein [Chitinivorax sp. B]
MSDCSHIQSPPPSTSIAVWGHWMRDHGSAIRCIQWVVVVVYLFLIIVPVCLPLPDDQARILNNLTLFAQFLFWGIWWPFVLVSMLLIGRSWCGVFCPEGALSEWASQHGRGGAIPRWAKWNGWPFVAFCLTTIYGQLVSVYQYPKAALLVLGGSTLVAMAIGLMYGKGKRVWCRHLCPVSGVFRLLSRLSPVYMEVDRSQWQAHGKQRVIPINCAPLVDIRRMQRPSDCHLCGRCAGHRNAVELAWRHPNAEITSPQTESHSVWDLILLVYGLLGVAIGAFQWTASPWFIMAKQTMAEWLIDHDILWPLDDNAPWWILTHYPEHNDTFTWLDGGMIVVYILTMAVVLGSWVILWLAAAARTHIGTWGHQLHRMANTLIPLAACGVFLGLSALTASLLKTEGLPMLWLNPTRATLLVLATLWSAWLLWQQGKAQGLLRRGAAILLLMPAWAGIIGSWVLLFWIW